MFFFKVCWRKAQENGRHKKTATVESQKTNLIARANSTESKKARPLNNKMANADTLDGAGVNSGNALDAAKLQNNSETTKDLAKKHCHRRTTEHEPNRVANSSSLEERRGVFKSLSEFSSDPRRRAEAPVVTYSPSPAVYRLNFEVCDT